RLPRDRVVAGGPAVGRDLAGDRERYRCAHRERDLDGRDVEVPVERLRPDRRGRQGRLGHLRWVVVVRVERLRRGYPERIPRLPCELREQIGDELLVRARGVAAAELIA